MRKFMFAAAAALLASVPANAVIVSGVLSAGSVVVNGGSFQVVAAPGTIATNQVNSPNVLGVNEQQKVTLAAAQRLINANIASGTIIANNAAAVAAVSTVISAGTVVNSHLIFLDPAGSSTRGATGTVTFNGRILGFILHDTGRDGVNFTNTNGIFGATGTTYGAMHSGLDGSPDAYSIGGSGNKTLSFTFNAGATSADFVRVITAVPEPRSWAMMLAGFGMVGFGMRRRRAAVAA